MTEGVKDRYGVMGYPVSHSRSPVIHRLFAAQTKQNIQYELLQVAPDKLEMAVLQFGRTGGKGLNITVPHKRAVCRLVDHLGERASTAGAVNTVVFREDSLFGDNTDGVGLMRDLRDNHDINLKGRNILILGAGGAGITYRCEDLVENGDSAVKILHDDRRHFEFIVLDGFQAGLAWITILRKREAFRAAFAGFDPEVIAGWGEPEVSRLLADPGIVRHRGKIEATIGNARAYLKIEEREGFNRLLWQFYDFKPLQNAFATMADVPPQTPVSKEISKALRSEGFKFCGPTIVYAFSEACGLVNDHIVGCKQHDECAAEAANVKF